VTGLDGGRALAIVNPVAGGGRTVAAMAELLRIFRKGGARVDMVRTTGAGEGARLARLATEDGYGKVIAVGGDGTVHEVANGLVGTAVQLAVVPLGSANDFAFSLGLRDWRLAARLAVLGEARPVDAALANGRAFVNSAGVGIDGIGAGRVQRYRRVLGPLAYLSAAVMTLATASPMPMRVHLDGEVLDGKKLLVVAANGERFGNGMRIAPGAQIDDGVLDVCIVGDAGRLEALMMFPTVYRGTHVRHPKVRMARVRRIVVEQEQRLPVELDGEPSEADRLEIECKPGALNVIGAARPGLA
jgi:diacylglycerol kinase (ATP)